MLDPLLDSDAGIVLELGSRTTCSRTTTCTDTGDAGVVIHQGSHGNRVEGGDLHAQRRRGRDRQRLRPHDDHRHHGRAGVGRRRRAQQRALHDRPVERPPLQPGGHRGLGNTNGLVVGGPAPHHGNDASHSLQTGFQIGEGVGIVVQNNTANLTGGAGIGVETAIFDALRQRGRRRAHRRQHDERERGGRDLGRGRAPHDRAQHGEQQRRLRHRRGRGADAPASRSTRTRTSTAAATARAATTPTRASRSDRPTLVQCLGVVCAAGDDAPDHRQPTWSAPDTTIVSGPPAGHRAPRPPSSRSPAPTTSRGVERPHLRVPARPAAGPAVLAGAARSRAAGARSAGHRHASRARELGRVLEPDDVPVPRAGRPPLRGARARRGRQRRPDPGDATTGPSTRARPTATSGRTRSHPTRGSRLRRRRSRRTGTRRSASPAATT